VIGQADQPDHESVAFHRDSIVATGGGRVRWLVVTDLDGRELFRATGVDSFSARYRPTYNLANGDVFAVGDDHKGHAIAHFPPDRIHMVLDQHDDVVIASTGGTAESYVIDGRGATRLDLHALANPPSDWLRTADGVWWICENYTSVWRIPPDGSATKLALPEEIRRIVQLGGHLYALGETAAYELASDGSIVRATAKVGNATVLDDSYLVATDAGVAVVSPSANVRRILHTAYAPVRLHATRDARVVEAALTSHDGIGPETIAVWRDPVPVDPAAIPAYIATLTNARLAAGADAITWDP